MIKLLLTAGSAVALLAAPVLVSAETMKPPKGETQKAQKGGETGGLLREGMQVLDADGNVIGVIVQVKRTRDGEIRQVKVRFDQFGRVMVKLVPKFQLKVKADKALTELVREQIEQLEDAPA